MLLLSNDNGQLQDAEIAWELCGCQLRAFPWQDPETVLQHYFHHTEPPPPRALASAPARAAGSSGQPAHFLAQQPRQGADPPGAAPTACDALGPRLSPDPCSGGRPPLFAR